MAATAVGTEIEPLEEPAAKALAEYMTVLDDVGMVRGASGLFEVTSERGREYIVDLEAPAGARCLCDDHKYRHRECKHLWRCRFATGAEPIPAWVDRDGVDDQLGAHVDGGPRWSR